MTARHAASSDVERLQMETPVADEVVGLCETTKYEWSPADEVPDQFFELGSHYELLQGRLYYSPHQNNHQTKAAIGAHKELFYFSSNLPSETRLMHVCWKVVTSNRQLCGFCVWPCVPDVLLLSKLPTHADAYRAYCKDWGPTNIAIVVKFCRFVCMFSHPC